MYLYSILKIPCKKEIIDCFTTEIFKLLVYFHGNEYMVRYIWQNILLSPQSVNNAEMIHEL